MTNLHRFHYRPHELDAPEGPVPTFGNPGALTPGAGEGYPSRHCTACDVRWRGDRACWCCGGAA
jgi:hypothetical protein